MLDLGQGPRDVDVDKDSLSGPFTPAISNPNYGSQSTHSTIYSIRHQSTMIGTPSHGQYSELPGPVSPVRSPNSMHYSSPRAQYHYSMGQSSEPEYATVRSLSSFDHYADPNSLGHRAAASSPFFSPVHPHSMADRDISTASSHQMDLSDFAEQSTQL